MLPNGFSRLKVLMMLGMASLIFVPNIIHAQTPDRGISKQAPSTGNSENPVPLNPKPSSTLNPGQSSTRQPLTQRFQELEKLKNQMTNFSDITRKDWAYEPIMGLMQKYGCLSGYPDGTFRGQQALTRNEFAAGLEACMNRMDALIQDRTANLVTREDLATLFRVLSTIFDNQNPNPANPPKNAPPPNNLPMPTPTPNIKPE